LTRQLTSWVPYRFDKFLCPPITVHLYCTLLISVKGSEDCTYSGLTSRAV
jgi:hypothetical protein